MSSRTDLFREALRRCTELVGRFPDVKFLESVKRQLEFLIDLDEGKRTDRANIKRLSIGIIAVREVEDLDSELYDLLIQAASEADRM